MSFVAHISDPHLHSFSSFNVTLESGVSSRLDASLSTFESAVDVGVERGARDVVVSGDLVHIGKLHLHKDFSPLVDKFRHIIEKHGRNLNFHFLAGNHDMASLDGEVHALEFLKGFAGCHVWDRPHGVRIADRMVDFVPFIRDPKEAEERLGRMRDDPTRGSILVLHAGIASAQMASESVIDHGALSPDLFEGWNLTIAGHYHGHQRGTYTGGEWIIPGSLLQVDSSEEGQAKGLVLVDYDSLDWEFVKVESPEFVTLKIPSDLARLEQLRDRPDRYLKLIGETPDITLADLRRLMDGARAKWTPDVTRQVSTGTRIAVNLDTSATTLADRYVRHINPPGFDIERLIKTGTAYLEKLDLSNPSAAGGRITLGKMVIENYRTIERAEFDFDRTGLYRVIGVNHDDDGTNDNGSGKSSLLEAPFWILTGEVLREEKLKQSVARNHADGPCRGSLVVKDATGRELQIERTYNPKTSKATLDIKIDGKSAKKLVQQKKRDTQEVLYEMLGLDDEILRTVDILTNSFEFLGSTEAKRTELLEKLMRATVFSEAREMVREDRKQAGKDLDAADTERRVKEVGVIGARNRIAELSAKVASFEAEKSRRVEAVSGQISSLLSTRIATETARHQVVLEQANMMKRADELKASAPDLSGLPQLVADIAACDTVLADERAALRAVETEMSKNAARLKHISQGHLVGQTCEWCGEDVTQAGAAGYQDRLHVERATLQTKFNEHAAMIDGAVAMRAEADTAKAALEKRQKDLDAGLLGATNFINTKTHELRTIDEALAGLAKQIEILEGQKSAIQAEQPAIAPLIEAERIALAEGEPALADLVARVETLREDLKYLEWWEVGFGPSGVRSFALDAVLPTLNDAVNRYISRFSSSLAMHYSPTSKTKKGDLREELSVNVESLSGITDIGSGSGGEQKRMMYSDLFARRALRLLRLPDLNVLIADEAFDQVDAAGIETLMDILQEEAKTKFVPVVTHNEHMAPRFQKVIKVERRGNVSRVEVV